MSTYTHYYYYHLVYTTLVISIRPSFTDEPAQLI